MTVLLSRSYAGTAAGQTVSYTTELEAALVAQNLGTVAAEANTTTGAQTQNALQGTAAIAAGALSVVITNNLVDANAHVTAKIAQSTADGTLTSILRVVPAAGSFTIFGNANATATTIVDWEIIVNSGMSQKLT